MTRRLAIAATAAVLLVPIAAASARDAAPPAASPAGCTVIVTWRHHAYRGLVARDPVPAARAVGTGVAMPCFTTHGGDTPGAGRRVALYAVAGVRPALALTVRGPSRALYVSRARATAAERRVLDRLRAG